MPKRNDEKIVFDDEEDEDIEDPVAIRDGSDEEESEDDEEGNEDLSLKILEKALSRRVSDDSKETSMSDLYGSGVVSTVMVNGDKSKANNKMKKRTNLEDEEIFIVEKDKDVEKVVEDSIKREDDDDDDVEKSAEPSSNLVLKKLLRGARYFDPPDAGWVSCYSCGEQGHTTVNCPTPTKRRKPCFICGSLEHGAKQCSKGHDCYICKKSGHRARDCPDKYKSGAKTAVCLRCGDFGHDMILCKYEYSRDDLKDIQCYVCKRFGHLCCVEPGDSPTWAVSCYRCGQLGHIGLACGRYYEESTEKDSASSCFRCGEEGHFSRECPNSLSISNSQARDSPNLCYRCFGEGHFARECPNSSQVSKRNRETSTPSLKSHKRFKESSEYNSTPHVSNGKKKKNNNKENSEHYSTPHESNGKKKKKNVENSEHNSTPHESNRKMKKKNIENAEHNSTPHESNGKMKKKSKEISEHNSTPHESNGQMKKKNKENSEHNSTPHESNEKSKKKKKKKNALKGHQPQISPHKPKQRGGWITEDPEEDYFQRETIRRPRSPITPSGHYHHRSPITPSGHYHHRSPITPSNHYHHRLPISPSGHNHHRLPTFNSGGHYQGAHSTTAYGRNHRISSFESYEHRSAHPPSTWQPDHPPTSSHYHHHHQQHQEHHQQHRYAPAPSRYGPAHRYGDFSGNYDRW